METFTALLIPALLTLLVLRIMAMPLKWFFKILIHVLGGFLCLWLLDTVSQFTGIFIPLNGITIAVAGFLGVPGIAFLAIAELMG